MQYIILLFLIIFFSCDSQYNKANSNFNIPLILPPSNVKVSQGDSLEEIIISWSQNSLINEVFVYRSESLNGTYKKIGSESYKSLFSDTNVEPGKIYYYKLKGYNFLYGESNFTPVVSGYRGGIGLDQYENDNELNKAQNILIGDENIQIRSIYPKDDIDFIKFEALKDNLYTIETLSTGKESNDNKFLRIYLYDSNYNLLRDNDYNYDSSIYTKKITKWLCKSSGYYYILVISILGSGGYKIKVNTNNEPPANVQYVTATYGSNSNFIKLNWATSYGAEKYYIYRSENNISGTFQNIDFYRTMYGTQKYNWTTLTEAYDKDVLPGKIYYYKIKATNLFGESGFSIAGGGFIADLTNDNFEPDNTTDEAKEFILGSQNSQERTLFPQGDIDWIKFSGKTNYYYYITTKAKEEFNAEVDTIIYLYDNAQNLLSYNDNNNFSNYSTIQNWFCDTTTDYFIKIISKDNFTGTYILEIKESKYYFR